MRHGLLDLYQVYLNHDPGAKFGPAPGVTCFTVYRKKDLKKILVLMIISTEALPPFIVISITVESVLRGHSKIDTKNDLNDKW